MDISKQGNEKYARMTKSHGDKHVVVEYSGYDTFCEAVNKVFNVEDTTMDGITDIVRMIDRPYSQIRVTIDVF